jgi:hypothetical protein
VRTLEREGGGEFDVEMELQMQKILKGIEMVACHCEEIVVRGKNLCLANEIKGEAGAESAGDNNREEKQAS